MDDDGIDISNSRPSDDFCIHGPKSTSGTAPTSRRRNGGLREESLLLVSEYSLERAEEEEENALSISDGSRVFLEQQRFLAEKCRFCHCHFTSRSIFSLLDILRISKGGAEGTLPTVLREK